VLPSCVTWFYAYKISFQILIGSICWNGVRKKFVPKDFWKTKTTRVRSKLTQNADRKRREKIISERKLQRRVGYWSQTSWIEPWFVINRLHALPFATLQRSYLFLAKYRTSVIFPLKIIFIYFLYLSIRKKNVGAILETPDKKETQICIQGIWAFTSA